MKIILEPQNIPRLDLDTVHIQTIGTTYKDSLGALFFGDNLAIMYKLLDCYKGKIDLVYIDPPFGTNLIFKVGKDRTGTISPSKNDSIAYNDTLTGDDFLFFIQQRLEIIKQLLSDKGSIYVHIDYKMGHYIKLIMDQVFGTENFRGDICRIKCNPKNFNRRGYGNIKDLILFYSKSDNFIWNEQKTPLSQQDIKNLYAKIDENGNRYTTIPLHAPGETKNGITGGEFKGIYPPQGRHWRTSPEVMAVWDEQGLIEWSKNGVPRKKVYYTPDKGKKIQDVWEFKDPQHPIYPTEKNNNMLERIIKTSSHTNSIILDCFAGSGGTLFVATQNNRKWVGIDNSQQAIQIIQNRFKAYAKQNTLFNKGINYHQLIHDKNPKILLV